MTTINKIFLRISRYIISRIPRGKSLAIKIALVLFGSQFKGTITAKDGRKFYIDRISLVKQQLFFVNEYEDYETELIKKIVKAGDLVLDIGASYGWYATLMARLVGGTGKVIAFELAPNIAEECRKNVSLNHMEDNIIIEDIALGEKDGLVDYIYSENLGLGNLNPQGLTGGGNLKIGKGRITTLDKYVEAKGIRRIDFIKCDVDGAEVRFLKGARKTLLSYKPVIIIEASGAHGRPSSLELFQELDNFGYKFFSLHYKSELQPIEKNMFSGNFKENILCLPNNKLNILDILG
jgi:FkbM family methyltransferase